MKVTKEEKNGVMVFKIEGEVNSANSTQLREIFASAIQEGKKKIVIDSSRMDYTDSSGLAAFIDLHVKMKRAGGVVGICSLNQKVKGVFEIAKLNVLFKIYNNLNEAISSA